MPVYEYVCRDCQHEFDKLRPMRDADTPIRCEDCHGERTQRKLSVFFAQSAGQAVAGTSSGKSCGGCAGGSCGSCGH
jgi:putative FmdB family regulatory protein